MHSLSVFGLDSSPVWLDCLHQGLTKSTVVTSVPFVELRICILQIYPLNSAWSFRALQMFISFST